jgi:endonuclease III
MEKSKTVSIDRPVKDQNGVLPMPAPEQMINQILFDKAKELHVAPRSIVTFTTIPESDALLNDIEKYPHIFVLGCIMDLQIPAERAWNIPCIIAKECGSPGFENFLSLDLNRLNAIFSGKRLHRFNSKMADNFHKAIRKIHTDYQDNAANIWLAGRPGCREVIDRFAQFHGVGQKISTMATNILVREFKVPLENVHEIDISVDSQVKKVYRRMGLVPAGASNEEIIGAARKIYPSYPGLADSIIWEIGRNWCKTDLSGCGECYLEEWCPKNPV